MSIVSLICVAFVVGFVIQMIMTVPLPVHPWVRSLISGILFLALLFWILGQLGINTGIHMRIL